MSFTTLYGLFGLTSIVLFNCLIVMSRYVQQTKNPPSDEEFEQLVEENKQLLLTLDNTKQELADSEVRFNTLGEKLQKTEDTLQIKLTELQALQSKQTAETPG